MGRIALFVIAVGGLGYLVLVPLGARLIGVSPNPLTSVSVSIILAVIAWTIIIWIVGDRGSGQPSEAEQRRQAGQPPGARRPGA